MFVARQYRHQKENARGRPADEDHEMCRVVVVANIPSAESDAAHSATVSDAEGAAGVNKKMRANRRGNISR